MPAITVRHLTDSVHAALKQKALAENLSVEALARRLLAAGSMDHAREAGRMSGFSEVSVPWGHAPARAAVQPGELWGALKGSVKVPPGVDLAAPLDEAWEADR